MAPVSNFVRPSTPPKYFGIDVDGTFYAKEAAAFDKNRKAFRKLVEAGYKPFLCTGRPLFSVQAMLGDLNKDGIYTGLPGVYQNGACVYDESGKLISVTPHKKSFIREVCDAAKQHGLEHLVVFFSATNLYGLAEESTCWRHLVKLWNMDWPLKVASVDEIVDADILEMLVADYTRLQVHLTSEEGVDFVAKQGACGLCDLSPPGITKVIGLRSLMQHAGATTKDCCYIGDGTNDMEAMEAVDLSFAVGNAIDSVKASAKYVVEETYEEAAFAKVVSLVYDIDVE